MLKTEEEDQNENEEMDYENNNHNDHQMDSDNESTDSSDQYQTDPKLVLDIGCGYGSLLLELAAIYADTPMLGIEIRPKVVEYVQQRVLALRHEARKRPAAADATAVSAGRTVGPLDARGLRQLGV